MLMCEVLEPDFLRNLVHDQPDLFDSPAGRTLFAEIVAERAQDISCDWVLERIMISCLFLDPVFRPKIGHLSDRMVNDAPIYQFYFEIYYS